jgi:hypothetical protein
MTPRSTLLRGSAALALALGLVATTTISPAYAKPASPQGAIPSMPAGVPGIPGLPALPTNGAGKVDVAQTIVGGLHMAADAADIVVPLIVDAVEGDE